MQIFLLVLIAILISLILALFGRREYRLYQLQHLVFSDYEINLSKKQLKKSKKAMLDAQNRTGNLLQCSDAEIMAKMEDYFIKQAEWEFDRNAYQDLLEGNLAVFNGRKTIQEVLNNHIQFFNVEEKITYYTVEGRRRLEAFLEKC